MTTIAEQKENLRPVSVRFHNGKGYEDRRGYFHCWSRCADEGGSTPIALIEWLDGTCTEYAIDKITFLDSE